MITSLKKYPKNNFYDGDPFNQIPSHWSLKRMRFVADINPLQSSHDLDNLDEVSFIPMECVNEYGGLVLEFIKPLDEIGTGYTFFKENDIVVAKITPCFENGKGSIAKGLKNQVAFGTTELHVIRVSKEVDKSFLFYLTISDQFRKSGEGHMYGAGGQKRISDKFIKDYRTPIPPIEEQQSIANFLNQKTAQIDALIEQKEKLLELLAEKRTAIITQAVTKGLNPKVKMKDSGIEWLGEVPEHWSTKRFKFCLSLPFQYGANEVAEKSDPDEPRFIRITDLGDDGGLREDTFKSLEYEIAKPFLLDDGDILLARSGATVGKTFMYREEWGLACFAGYLIRARLNKRIVAPSFCIRFLNSGIYWSWVNSIFIQATIQNISAEKYASLSIPLPPLEEQLKICDYLDSTISKIDGIRNKLMDSVEKLKEYRNSLITSAVTGQINVSMPLQSST